MPDKVPDFHDDLGASGADSRAEGTPRRSSSGQRMDTASAEIVGAAIDAALGSLDPYAREQAAHALRRFPKRQAIPRLINLLEADPERKIRMVAASALGDQGDEAAIEALVECLRRDMEMLVRLAAAEALYQVGISMHDADIKDTVFEGLTLALYDQSAFVRLQAARSLGTMGGAFPELTPRALGVLARSLRDDLDVAIRKEAAWSLGKLKDEGAVPHLLAALTDTGEVRRLAAGALGELGENIRTPDLQERSLNALIDLLVDPYLPGDAEISVMGMAAFALGEIGDRQAVSALIKAVDSPSGHLRMLATRALGKIGDPAAVPALIACLEDTFSPGWSEERVCDIAAAGLSDINTAEAQAALERWSTRLE